jgi:protease I
VAFDFDGTEVIARRGQAVTAAPHEKHRDRCASDEPAIAFLCVTPHTPPTHTAYAADGTRLPARAGVATPTWMGQPPLGHEQTAPIFAAWEAAHGAGAHPGSAANGQSSQAAGQTNNGQANGQAHSTAIGSLSEHQGRHFSSAERFSEAERNGTPFPEQSRGKILLAIGDAAEATDTLYPWMRLMEAGYECVVAAPEVRSYQLVLHERPAGWHITRETPGYSFDADVAFKDVKPEEYAGILISGGRAPEYIRYDQALLDTVRWMVDRGRPVGSICHGIEVLATAGVIKGKRVTCVPKCQFDAEVCGATYVAAPVVVDGLMVTARGARDGWLWMREFLKVLDQVEGAAAAGGAGRVAVAAGSIAPTGAAAKTSATEEVRA